MIDALIEREGGYVDHPADKGGPTCFGITEAVARAHGYAGPMRQLPRDEAAAIYTRLYWLRPRLDEVARRSERLAAELFDTGVNMGPAVAVTFLQRALTALNRNGKDYPDLVPDGRVGAATLAALDAFLALRGEAARPFSFARSKRSRASATSASPSAAQPMRHSSMGGSRTVLVSQGNKVEEVEGPPFSLIRRRIG